MAPFHLCPLCFPAHVMYLRNGVEFSVHEMSCRSNMEQRGYLVVWVPHHKLNSYEVRREILNTNLGAYE